MKEEKIDLKSGKRYFLMDIDTFEKGVLSGEYTDLKGTAYLVLNDKMFVTYNVYIDRRRITKAGAVLSFDALLKEYGPEQIKIRYETKKIKLPNLETYKINKDNKRNRRR